MVKFKLEDYKNLNITTELVNALTSYNGVLPMLLKPFIKYEQHINNLKENGAYEQVQKEYAQIRKEFIKTEDKRKYREDELIRWLNDNPQFDELLTTKQ